MPYAKPAPHWNKITPTTMIQLLNSFSCYFSWSMQSFHTWEEGEQGLSIALFWHEEVGGTQKLYFDAEQLEKMDMFHWELIIQHYVDLHEQLRWARDAIADLTERLAHEDKENRSMRQHINWLGKRHSDD